MKEERKKETRKQTNAYVIHRPVHKKRALPQLANF
jgi:hypothetical protein